VHPESGVDCGGGGAVPSVLAELLPPPQPPNAAMASASHKILLMRIALLPKRGALRRPNSAPALPVPLSRDHNPRQGHNVPIFSVGDW
jgi:hypothetical protein